MANGTGAHADTVDWADHVEEVERVRAELTAENMRLEALLEKRNRQIDSLAERLGQAPDAPDLGGPRVTPEMFRLVGADLRGIETYAAKAEGLVMTVEMVDPAIAPDYLYFGPSCDLAFKASAHDLSSGETVFATGWAPATGIEAGLRQAADQLQASVGGRIARNRPPRGSVPERPAPKAGAPSPSLDASRAASASRAQRPVPAAARAPVPQR